MSLEQTDYFAPFLKRMEQTEALTSMPRKGEEGICLSIRFKEENY